ncbi:MAG: TIGR02266 family protein [Pseudomonadota bacterium]
MFNVASEESYPSGQVIFKEGSSGDWVYVVLKGAIEISKMIGGQKFIVGIVREGEVFGELSFLGGINRTATAIALDDSTVGTLDRQELDAEFNKISSEFRTIIVASVKRFAKMLDRTCDFSARTEPRIPKTLSLTYKDRSAFIKAYTGNISIGGLFIKTEKPLKQGETFLLKLQLPGLAEPMAIKSEVAWSKKGDGKAESEVSGMGIRFVEMTKADSRSLADYIKEIQKSETL